MIMAKLCFMWISTLSLYKKNAASFIKMHHSGSLLAAYLFLQV
jgi:hypothetical protein